MGRYKLNITLISFHILLFSLFICTLTASSMQMTSDPIKDFVCGLINCGQGNCTASNTSIIGFDCECYRGWKKIQIGPLTFPACVVPNCTLDFNCGNPTPPSPPPPPPSLPPFNLTNPCALVWCGDGTCVTNGTGYTCQCNEGSANLGNMPGFACFKECYFGADCNGVGGHPVSPPSNSGSPGNGGVAEVPNCSRNFQALTIILLAAIFLTWI